jgi:hypothetical protein
MSGYRHARDYVKVIVVVLDLGPLVNVNDIFER